MRKAFIVICRPKEKELVNIDKEMLYFSPMYEHTYRKFADAIKYLKMDYEVVRSSAYTLEGASSELDCSIEDIIIFTHPLAFLAEREDIEKALTYVDTNDLSYAMVGTADNLYATIGTGKMLIEDTVSSPYEFIDMNEIAGK